MVLSEVIPAEQVRQQLDRILASPEFSGADRLTRFLRFAVERTLDGQGGGIKEYLLGTEVFDRGTDFDPRMDPIVRVEAHRLRAKLQSYYTGAGQGDPVRIVFRKGSYAPSFEMAQAAPAAVPRHRVRPWMMVVALVAAVAVTLAVHSSITEAPISVAVFAGAGTDAAFTEGLGGAVSAELARNTRLRVMAWPLVQEYRKTHPGLKQESAGELGVDAVLYLAVEQEAGRRRVIAFIVRAGGESKEWAGSYERGMDDSFAAQNEIARAMAEEANRVLPRLP